MTILNEDNNPQAEYDTAKLLSIWRQMHRSIFYIQRLSREADFPLRPDHPGPEIKEIVKLIWQYEI